MRITKSIIAAFSIYSNIPMPQLNLKNEDMEYMLCFFPWIGAVIGVGIYLWRIFCDAYAVGSLCYTLGGAFIPLIITGGFHVDGFMDTMDAFHSYKTREEKLKILKDSHIGAFAVIMLAAYGLLYLSAFSEIRDKGILRAVCAGFVLSRCLSAIGVVSFQPAKKEGMLYSFADSAKKGVVKIFIYIQGILCILFMLWQSRLGGAVIAAAALLSFIYYYFRTKRELGGITGDTAGYFVLICEAVMMAAGFISGLK